MAVPAARLVCAIEIEAYACEILASHMEEGRLDPAPIWTDLKTFDGKPWRGVVDCLAAGYPCQPFSCAGKQRGAKDPRHLWPHVKRIIEECEPSLVILENVANHLNIGFDTVGRQLSELGYRFEAGLFEACEVGAPHHRRRLYVVAHHHHHGRLRAGLHLLVGRSLETVYGAAGSGADVGHRHRQGLEGGSRLEGADERAPWPPSPSDELGWKAFLRRFPGAEPALRGNAHGVAPRVDRLRLCGNGVVPAQAALAIRTLAARLFEVNRG
jgi:DNA (cytosine-5)-methyltransferase 1